MLFQRLVIANNVQIIVEPLLKQHEKTSRVVILWFQKCLLNETMQEDQANYLIVGMPHWGGYGFTHS